MREMDFQTIRKRLQEIGYDAEQNSIGTMFSIKQGETNLFVEPYLPTFISFAEGFCFAHYVLNHKD